MSKAGRFLIGRIGYAVSLPEIVCMLLIWVWFEPSDDAEPPEDDSPLEPPLELPDELSKLEPLDLPLEPDPLPLPESLPDPLPEEPEPLPVVAPSGPAPLPDDSGTLARSLWTHAPSAR